MATDNGEKRPFPPSDFIWTVECFNILAKSMVEKFESQIFNAGGYNWKLVLYPNGHTVEGRNHLSLYLKLAESHHHQEVTVYFRLYVFNQKQNLYISDKNAKHTAKTFDKHMTQWGCAKLLKREELSEGYVVENEDGRQTCVFGAEVYVIKQPDHQETFSLTTNPSDPSYKWPIHHFSTLGEKRCESPVFTVEERQWKLHVYPSGHGDEEDGYITIGLKLAEYERVKQSVFAVALVQIVNQSALSEPYVERKIEHFFNSAAESFTQNLLSREEIYGDQKESLRKNDTLIVRVEFKIISVAIVNNG